VAVNDPIAFYSPLVGLISIVTLVVWWLKRYERRLEEAMDRCDVVAAQKVLDQIARVMGSPGGNTRGGAIVALNRAVLLQLQDRWAEARKALLAIDRALLTGPQRAILDNNLAWCLAHEGRGEEAVELARAALARAKRVKVPSCLGTLGAALLAAGKSTEALTYLQDAIRRGGRNRDQATRLYHVGECQRALGRPDLAEQAYAEAVRLAPQSQFARHARERLSELSAAPYR
jgi:tetratricopeptide (TPR) repeat protein